MKLLPILPLLSSLIVFSDAEHVFNLLPGDKVQILGERNALGYDSNALNIFCYDGNPLLITNLFNTLSLRIRNGQSSIEFSHYQGDTPEAVREYVATQKSLFSFNWLQSNSVDRIRINAFNATCIGIEALGPYQVTMELIRLDMMRVALFIVAILLFFSAGKLSGNALFFYLCGISIGVFASVLVLIYFASKLLPRRGMMYGAMLGGWALVMYFGQMMVENLQMIFVTYKDYVLYYCLVTGFISFVVCYRFGPPQDIRSKNLIKWTLQLGAIILIHNSTDSLEATVAMVVASLMVYYFPWRVCVRGGNYLMRRFRTEKPRLLTREEFERQGVIETAKALEELKRYCSSPECKQWSTVMRLKDPSRFASFIEGESHLLDSEILDYECSDLNISEDNSYSENDSNEAGDVGRGGGGRMISNKYLISEEDEESNDEELRGTPVRLSKSYAKRGISSTPKGAKLGQRIIQPSMAKRLTPQRRTGTPNKGGGGHRGQNPNNSMSNLSEDD